MGNITSLQRCGLQADSVSYGVIDDLTLTYSGNQLVGVSDAAIDEPTAKDAQHFHDWANESEEYAYDANGNMTRDANSGIIFVVYDINNQPDSVRFNGTDAIRYYYDAMGNRLGSDEYALQIIPFNSPSRGVFPNFPPIVPPRPIPHQERRFCDNIIYDGTAISQILVDGGYITFDENTNAPLYHFYITDHQGNNRVVVDANGNVEERNDYYPYGALMSNSTTSIQRYKYNGKELNQHSYMLWYDYMARQTMPILGRFSSVDPLCEKYYGMSPYSYCAGNPVRYVDKDGMAVFYYKGKEMHNDGNNDELIYLVPDDFDKKTRNLIKSGDKCTIDKCILLSLSKDNLNDIGNIIGRDDGRGKGTNPIDAPQYFKEYGGCVIDGAVVEYPAGEVSDPTIDKIATISLPTNHSTFHTHPSGWMNPRADDNYVNGGQRVQYGSLPPEGKFEQRPSDDYDILNFKQNTYVHYVFGRRNNTTYICQKVNGVVKIATMNTSSFLNLR